MQETFVGFLNSLPHFDDRARPANVSVHDCLAQADRRAAPPGPASAAQPRRPRFRQSAGAKAATSSPGPPAPPAARNAGNWRRTPWCASSASCWASGASRAIFSASRSLELLFVKGWANKDVAELLQISEQQVANIRFAAVKKIATQMRAAGLPEDVFPELDRLQIEK